MEMNPIAFFHCDKKNPSEAARQGSVDLSASPGEIRFVSGMQYEQALENIEDFSHLWILYHFHQNSDWKPKVLPPRGSAQKRGVFATRSPYRPNPIGLSCVELIKKEALSLWVQNFDLLDQTPIWDIKPYLAYADSFPTASLGWLSHIHQEEYLLKFSTIAIEQLQFLKDQGLSQIENVIQNQLSFDPLNNQKKRVKSSSDSNATLAYRTWRVHFTIFNQEIKVDHLSSGYSEYDLLSPEDPHLDKNIHREFQIRFAQR